MSPVQMSVFADVSTRRWPVQTARHLARAIPRLAAIMGNASTRMPHVVVTQGGREPSVARLVPAYWAQYAQEREHV